MQFFKCKMRKSSAKKETNAENASIHTVYCSFCACYSYLFNANGEKIYCSDYSILSLSYAFEPKQIYTMVFKTTQSKTVELIAIE